MKEDVEGCLSALGEKILRLSNFSKSVEIKWPVSSVAEGPTAIVAVTEAVAHWGVGAAVATTHAVPQGVAVAAPVAAWEDGAGEGVAVHGIRSGGLR